MSLAITVNSQLIAFEPVGGSLVSPTLRWPIKAPGDVDFFTYDLTAWAQIATPNDSIDSFTAAIAPAATPATGDMAISGQALNKFQCTVALTAGNANVDYGVTFTINFQSGRVHQRTVWITCQPLTANRNATPSVVVGPQGPQGPAGATGATGPAGPIVPATELVIGAVKPGTLMQVAADGTINPITGAGGVLVLDAGGNFQIKNGATAGRPANAAAGTQYLDTSLGFVVTSLGNNTWINAAGAVV